MAQKEYKKPVPRRSSLIAKQFAEENGVDLQLSDVFRALPQNVQDKLSRLSNSRRSSNINLSYQNSVNPTPLNSVKPRGNLHGSGIPIPWNSSVRKGKPVSKFSGTAEKGGTSNKKGGTANRGAGTADRRGGAVNRGISTADRRVGTINKGGVPTTSRNLSAARHQMGSMQNLAKNVSFASRRSMSADSLYRDNGVTPNAYTPRTPRTGKTPSCSDMSNYPIAKTIKIPNSTDKAIINRMAHDVNEFLQSKNYSRRMTLHEFLRMPSSEYVNICVFVGSLMMGPSYFKGKDMVLKIFELSNLLKYPGTITKSHLKCANIPHSWPYALTFLAWLCARVAAALSVDSSKPISEISNNDYNELAAESYMVLFSHEMNTGVRDPDLYEAELQSFKQKLQEKYMGDIPRSTEELEAIRDAELQKLEKLESTPNPLHVIQEAKNKYQTILDDENNKMKESKRKWSTYKDVSALDAQSKMLISKFQEKKREYEELKLFVRNQPLDKNKVQQIKHEIETYDKQINAIETMTKKLSLQLVTKQTQNTNLQKQFYDVCANFTIVENFKEAVRKLRVQLPTIPPNPYEPSGLKTWVDEVQEIQHLANKKILALESEIKEKFQKIERNKNQRLQALDSVEKKKLDVEEDLKKIESQHEVAKKEQEIQMGEMTEVDKELKENITFLTNEREELSQECNKLQTSYDNHQKEMGNKQAEEKEWKDKAENLTIDLMEEADQMNAYWANYLLTKTAELREIRLKENLDVELFDELLKEMKETGIPSINFKFSADDI